MRNLNQIEASSSLEPTGLEPIAFDYGDQRHLIIRNIRLAQMNFRNDSEMLPPPLIPINMIEHQTPSFADQNVSSQPKTTSLSKARKAGTKSRTRSNAQSKMSHVLQKPSPWKCTVCSGYFSTIRYLREHIAQYHFKRTWFCIRCPHTSDNKIKIDEHEQDRDSYGVINANVWRLLHNLCNISMITH